MDYICNGAYSILLNVSCRLEYYPLTESSEVTALVDHDLSWYLQP